MAKLSFSINTPEPPKPLFPGWVRVALYVFVMGACATLILVLAPQNV